MARTVTGTGDSTWWSCVIGSVLSIGFWGSLIVASTLFAIVVLSPRVVAYVALDREFYETQRGLIALQQQVRQLERVEQGMRHDSRFVAEVARQELDSTHPHDLLLSVSPELKFDAFRPQTAPQLPVYQEAWYVQHFRTVQQDTVLRQRLCLFAAGLLIFGFVLLHDGPGPRRVVQLLAEPLRQLLIRYRSSSHDSRSLSVRD